ncbi:hypothetical protein [uncultured Parabacteroides sp.]|uniref:hypothetical protein n=1 Tax=uncultured Parabacteroides sp. TaxID=512312 RepID=UPI0025861903|nr:hypothetical protein [uncultured Parabacteroides sp.]
MNKYLVIFNVLILLLVSCNDVPGYIEPPTPPNPEPPASQDTVWSNYLSSSYNLIKDSVWSEGDGCSFWVSSRKFYFNEESRSNCFLGMLVDTNFDSSETAKSVNSDLVYNKTAFVGDTLVFEINSPSSNSMDSVCRIMNENYIKGELGALGYNEYEFNSPKELYLKFVYNNLRMDSLLYGSNYTEIQMTRKSGYIFSTLQLYYNLAIDIPKDLVINKDVIEECNRSDLAYIKSIWYGKMKYLVVETNYSKGDIKSCLTKIKNNEILSINEQTIVSTSLFSLITVTSKGNNVINGGLEVVEEYYNNKSDDITALYCTFSNFMDNSVSDILRKIDFIF